MSGIGQPPPGGTNPLAAAIAQIAQQQAARQQADDARRVREHIVGVLTAAFDKGMAYTNLILLGGYAGAFAIWANVKEHLSETATISVALALSFSLTAFVLFEVYKMVYETKRALKHRAILIKAMAPADFLKTVQALKTEEDEKGLKYFLPIWAVNVFLTVASALVAIGLLFYNFLAVLLCFPQWPT